MHSRTEWLSTNPSPALAIPSKRFPQAHRRSLKTLVPSALQRSLEVSKPVGSCWTPGVPSLHGLAGPGRSDSGFASGFGVPFHQGMLNGTSWSTRSTIRQAALPPRRPTVVGDLGRMPPMGEQAPSTNRLRSSGLVYLIAPTLSLGVLLLIHLPIRKEFDRAAVIGSIGALALVVPLLALGIVEMARKRTSTSDAGVKPQ